MTPSAFDVSSLIRSELRDLAGYTPIEPTDVLAERLGIAPGDVAKLDGNENPYGPSPRALEALSAYRGYHIYPDPDQRKIREALSQHLDVSSDRIV